jgi:hypothetical protein
MIHRERAEAGRPDEDTDQDEPDDRADSQPREGRNDDAGGAEDYERVAKARGAEFCSIAPLLPFSSEQR